MKYIIKSSVNNSIVYYTDSKDDPDWTSDKSSAATYPDEASARVALDAIPFFWGHHKRRAQVVPA